MVPSSLLPKNIDCTFPDLVDPPIALTPIGSLLDQAHLSFKYSDAISTTRDPAPTTHLGGNPHSGHEDWQLEGYMPGFSAPARPGNIIPPPFPSATLRPGAYGDNSEGLRGSDRPRGSVVDKSDKKAERNAGTRGEMGGEESTQRKGDFGSIESKDRHLRKPMRWAGGAGGKWIISRTLIFAWVLVMVNSYCYA
jgi:hypothetical protein